RPTGGGEDVRAIAGAVVGQHAAHAHAAASIPRDGAAEKGGDGRPFLIDEDFGVRHPRAVVDAHVHKLPADAPRLTTPIAGDAMPDGPGTPGPLEVPMQRPPRPR